MAFLPSEIRLGRLLVALSALLSSDPQTLIFRAKIRRISSETCDILKRSTWNHSNNWTLLASSTWFFPEWNVLVGISTFDSLKRVNFIQFRRFVDLISNFKVWPTRRNWTFFSELADETLTIGFSTVDSTRSNKSGRNPTFRWILNEFHSFLLSCVLT